MPLTVQQKRMWLRYIRAIREKYPPPFTVTIRTCRLGKTLDGLTTFNSRNGKVVSAKVAISNRLPYHGRLDSLVHEYAHVMSWTFNHHENDRAEQHDEAWGTWYAKIYRVIEEVSDESREQS